MTHAPRICAAVFGLGIAAACTIGIARPANAQAGVDPQDLEILDPSLCNEIVEEIRGRESGGQWLVGSGIDLFPAANATSPMLRLSNQFEPVSCYSRADVLGPRVFVASAESGICGWVETDDLLSENPLSGSSFQTDRRRSVCETPRAMPFDDYCQMLAGFGSADDEVCDDLPPGLRAKGVIVGSTAGNESLRYPIMSAPVGGVERGSQSFFSILEIHDLAQGDAGSIMALVGDGEGTVFGWTDLRSLELWPTRMGMFYDEDGTGRMFSTEGDMLQQWRERDMRADVLPGLNAEGLSDYIHGSRQLFSYPIVRTVLPSFDAAAVMQLPYHEVIFFGQTGEGSATQLIEQAELAERVEALTRLNLMIVMDTTESMRDYLEPLRAGLAGFIDEIGGLSLNPANNIPELRIAVYAYSDFSSANSTGLDDPISMAALMSPVRIDRNLDLTDELAGISSHSGLDDEAGRFAEASLEAVLQQSEGFETGSNWFEDGPRIVIHIADHGSRPDTDFPAIRERLNALGVYYFPLAVATDDEGDPSRTDAREAMPQQALPLMSRYIDGPTLQDVSTIDFRDPAAQTVSQVRDRLFLVLAEAIAAVEQIESDVTGGLVPESALVRDMASSRIRLDEELIEQFGLGNIRDQVIVRASTAFAPFELIESGIASEIDWTYTVALEPFQTNLLRQNFERMCSLAGSPDRLNEFRDLIYALAQVFSGDVAADVGELRAIMKDLREMPGASGSFMAQTPQELEQRIFSSDPAIVERMRQDVCWTSYHLGNVANGFYARPEQLLWTGQSFRLRDGQEVIARRYRDQPIIGPELDYLPSFFFIAPGIIEASDPDVCSFFDTSC